MWFDVCVVSSLAACVAPNWGVASLRRVLCGWPALVGWRFLCLCSFDGFLLWVRIAYAWPTIASLCNIGRRTKGKVAQAKFNLCIGYYVKLSVIFDASNMVKAILHVHMQSIEVDTPTEHRN